MIYLLWPTVRPKVMIKTFKHWIETADNPSQIKIKIAVNTKSQADVFKKIKRFDDIIIVGDKQRGVAAPSFALSYRLKAEPDDIVILASDDFYTPQHWDTLVKKEFEKHKHGCLIVDDGLQQPYSELLCAGCGDQFESMSHDFNRGCITIPIMTFRCLMKLKKIIYHPVYGHLWSDAELFQNLKELEMLIDVRDRPDLYFEHRHWGNKKRLIDKHDKLAYGNVQKSRTTFNMRIKSGDYSLRKRLKITRSWVSYAKNAIQAK